MRHFSSFSLLLTVVSSLFSVHVASARAENAFGSPGEVVRYHFVHPEDGASVDTGYWPVDDQLTKQLYIYNNDNFYVSYIRTKKLENVTGKDLTDFLSDYYVALHNCSEGKTILRWNDCLNKTSSMSIIRRSVGGDFSISWEDVNGKSVFDTAVPFAKNPRKKLSVKKYRFVERNIEVYSATSEKIVAFEERGKTVREAKLKRQREEEQRKRELEREAQLRRDEKKRLAEVERYQKSYSDDREPTEREMNAAMRGTLAGTLLNVSVTKLGSCRKAAPYDYYCRYNYFGANWGNFWKSNGRWYFKRSQ